jgi:3-methyladenine DNA glycosylase AlkD
MATVASILAELKKKGTAQAQKTYGRHGMPPEYTFGTSIADIKRIAKTIKGQQGLACELYAAGKMEAMYLAALVADGGQLTAKQLDEWANAAANLRMVAEYNLPWVTVENPNSRELALKWMTSKKELVASAGWSTYSGIVALTPDEALDLKEIEKLLATVVREINTAPNRVRYTMNNFVISVGCHVKPLSKQATAVAKQIGAVTIETGDTDCRVPLATSYIEKAESMGRLGRKRKTIRC